MEYPEEEDEVSKMPLKNASGKMRSQRWIKVVSGKQKLGSN